MNTIAKLPNLQEIADKRDADLEALESSLAAISKESGTVSSLLGSYSGVYASWDETKKVDFEADFERIRQEITRRIDGSIWVNLLARSGMDQLMTAKMREDFVERASYDPFPVTTENLRATFSNLYTNREATFNAGLAEILGRLDKRFKSHDVFKFKSRIILSIFGEWSRSNSHNIELLIDLVRALDVLSNTPERSVGDLSDILRDYRQSRSEHIFDHFKINLFQNGNAHLWFKDKGLLEKVNKCIAAHYGEILPDAVTPEDPSQNTSTAVSKDLQFYPTPKAACEWLVNKISNDLRDGITILEPSAGDGALVEAVHKTNPRVEIRTIEVETGRVARLKENCPYAIVQQANFLTIRPRAIFDLVVMNPPFYGTHWMDHVYHAFKFLAPRGKLYAILPVTAEVGESKKHHEFQAWVKNNTDYSRSFYDLPAGSFKESGTNINTVLIKLEKKTV